MQGAMILMIGTMTVKVVSMLFKIPISNLLGGTGYSYFTNAYEIFNLISTIATAGFPVAISKLVSENGVLGNYRDNHKIFRISRTFFLITGLLCMTVMILGAGSFAAMIPNPGAKLSIICLAPAVLTCCLMSAYRGYYQGMQNMYPTSISQIIEAVTKMIFGLGFSGGVMYLTQREYSLHATVLGRSYPSPEQAQAVIAQLASGAAVLGVSLSTAAGLVYLMLRWRKKGDGVSQQQLMHAPKPQDSSILLKRILVIAIPVCLGSLAVNLSGIIDLLTVTGRLSHVMDTAPQQLLACYGQNIPQAELVNGTVHNYLYGAYSGKAVVIANLVPALTTGMAVSAAAGSSGEFCKRQPPAYPKEHPDGAAHHSAVLCTGRIGHQRPVAGGVQPVLWHEQRGDDRRAAAAGAGSCLHLHRPDRHHQQPAAGCWQGQPCRSSSSSSAVPLNWR